MADVLTEDELRAMAIEADAAARKTNEQDDDATPPEPAQPADQKPAEHDTEAEAQTAPDSEKEPSPDQPKAKAGDRKEKETQRLEKTWAAVNADKEKLAAERAELEKLRAEIDQQRAQQPQQQQPQQPAAIRDNTGRTAADYKEAAKMLRDEGEDSLAELADRKAGELEQAEQQAQQQQSIEQAKAAWMDSVNNTLKARPELADPNHELSKAVKVLIEKNPGFVHLPNGFALAAEVAASKLAAGRVAALESEAKELRAQLEAERKKLAPAGGGASFGQPGAKNLATLPAARREAELLALAAAIDSQG